MNILAVGDIVGNIGINELQKMLPKIKREYNIDFFDIDKVLYMMDKKNKTLNGKEKE